MRFSRTLASIALALSFALGSSVGAFAVPSTTPTTPPTEASPDATVGPTEVCITPDVVVGDIISTVPGADIKSVSNTPPYVIVFTSPQMSMDYQVTFDENGCFIEGHEISKVQV